MAEPVVQMTPWTYRLFWLVMGSSVLFALYWIIRWAVAAGIDDALSRR